MAEELSQVVEADVLVRAAPETEQELGRRTVLEALAVETTMVSIDMSRQSTQDGSGVDFEDD